MLAVIQDYHPEGVAALYERATLQARREVEADGGSVRRTVTAMGWDGVHMRLEAFPAGTHRVDVAATQRVDAQPERAADVFVRVGDLSDYFRLEDAAPARLFETAAARWPSSPPRKEA